MRQTKVRSTVGHGVRTVYFKKSHDANSVFSSDASPHSKSDNKWFNDDCRDAREEIYRCLNLFRNDKSEINCKI